MTLESTSPDPVVTNGIQPIVESPVVDTSSSATGEADSGEGGGAPNEGGETDSTSGGSPNNPKATPEWAQKRINELTAKRYEAERTAASEREARVAAETRTAELLAQVAGRTNTATETPPPGQSTAASSEEEIERRATEKAIGLARMNEFNKACNAIVATGKKEFKDWDDALKNLSLVGAIGQGANPDFLETAVELVNPHQVLHYLGTNLEEAEKVTNLSPKKMALELARIEAMLNAPPPTPITPPVSNAPPPVIPVGGASKTGNLSIGDPALSSDEWFALRARQVEERKGRYRRV